MMVTAWIVNPDTGADMQVNVLLDTGSTVTLIALPTADQIQLKGEEISLNLSGVTDVTSKIKSRMVEFDVETMDRKTCCGAIKRAKVIPVISNDVSNHDWTPVFAKHGLEGYPPANTGRIDVLIGWSNPLFLLQVDRKIITDQFVLIKSILGWSACGLASRRVAKNGEVHYTYERDGNVELAMKLATAFEPEAVTDKVAHSLPDTGDGVEATTDTVAQVLPEVGEDPDPILTTLESDPEGEPSERPKWPDASGDAEWTRDFSMLAEDWLENTEEIPIPNTDRFETVF